MTQTTEQSIVETVTKTSPPVVVSGLWLGGIPLSQWVLIATLVYTLLQTYFLLRDKWWVPRQAKKALEAAANAQGGK